MKVSSRAQAMERLLDALWSGEARVLASASEIAVVGHRIVHGGPHHEEPTLITSEVKNENLASVQSCTDMFGCKTLSSPYYAIQSSGRSAPDLHPPGPDSAGQRIGRADPLAEREGALFS
jgi:hypothetical protein